MKQKESTAMSRLVLKYESTQQNTFDNRKGLCESTHDSHGSTHDLWVDSYTDESTQQKPKRQHN